MKRFGKKTIIILCAIIAAIAIGGSVALVFMLERKSDKPGDHQATEEAEEQAENTASEEVSAPDPKSNTNHLEANPEESASEADTVVEYVERKVMIRDASASSYLKTVSQDGQTYEPFHVIDGNYTTAWIEGKDDLGIGESLSFDLGNTERITRMLIYNGFLNTKYRYAINGKVTRLLVEFDDGTSQTVDVNTMSAPDTKVPFTESELGPTEVIFDEPVNASGVKLTILDAVQGTKYKDVCISEVEIYHEEESSSVDQGEEVVNNDVMQAYEEYFQNNFPPTEYGGYKVAFAFMDHDDIPELIVEQEFDESLYTILQYDNGTIYTLGESGMISYIEKGNLIQLSWCDGQDSEDVLYRISGHTLEQIEGKGASYIDDGIIRYYRIDANGKESDISEGEYNNAFNNYPGKFRSPSPFWNFVLEAGMYINSKPAQVFRAFLDDAIKMNGRTYSEMAKEYYNDRGQSPDTYLYDVDGDYEYELLIDNYYGFDIYDCRNGELCLLDCGDGTAAICNLYRKDGKVYVGHADFQHAGRQTLDLTRYDSDGKAVEELNLNAEYWENENDQYDKNSDFSFCGQKITMQEYEQYLKDFAYINPYDMPRIN
ncbi:MAG: discoidin domain-containing protein [Lachnospiraceae bacterium]|nr:discoidin domain-containing protein [Lachnospiraceae bacterium]